MAFSPQESKGKTYCNITKHHKTARGALKENWNNVASQNLPKPEQIRFHIQDRITKHNISNKNNSELAENGWYGINLSGLLCQLSQTEVYSRSGSAGGQESQDSLLGFVVL